METSVPDLRNRVRNIMSPMSMKSANPRGFWCCSTPMFSSGCFKSTKAAKEIDKDDNRFISAVNDAEGTEQARADVLVFATACKNSLTLCSANQIFFRNIASPMPRQLSPKTVTPYGSFFRLHSMAPQTANAVPNAPASHPRTTL